VRRLRHLAAVAGLLVVCCSVASAAPHGNEIELVTTTLPTLNPGQTAWVSTLWRGTDSDSTEFKLTAEPPQGSTVSYPENTGSYSSLYKDSTLLAGDTDYAALKITVADDASGTQTIKLNVEYRAGNNGNGNGQGAKVKLNASLPLPVVAFNGPAVEQLTSSVGPLKAGEAKFVDISYKANKPGVTNARLTATAPEGATVIYPNDGTFAGFADDPDLSVGETDHASFKIDSGSLKPGSYTLQLDLAYGSGQHVPGTATLQVVS
jgi:hypothetical protein